MENSLKIQIYSLEFLLAEYCRESYTGKFQKRSSDSNGPKGFLSDDRNGSTLGEILGMLQEQSELQKVVVPLRSDRDLVNWERIDDVIMGGQSSSSLQPSGNGQTAVWSGDLIIEGGGFCGTRNKVSPEL